MRKLANEADQRREDVNHAEGRDLIDALKNQAGEIRKVADVVPVAGDEELHQRSISPTTISIDPRTTMASATVPPTVISRSAERLINEGGRIWKR